MYTIQGTGGYVTSNNGVSVKVDVWSCSFVTSTVETTGFGDMGMRVHEPTLLQVSGSYSGTLTGDLLQPLPANTLNPAGGPGFAADNMVANLSLGADQTYAINVQAILTNIAISRPEDGKATMTADFLGTANDAAGDMVDLNNW